MWKCGDLRSRSGFQEASAAGGGLGAVWAAGGGFGAFWAACGGLGAVWAAGCGLGVRFGRQPLKMRQMPWGGGGVRPQSTHRVAIADFWHTFHHEGKISPGWCGCGAHAHPPFNILPSRTKLQYTLELSAMILAVCSVHCMYNLYILTVICS
jgi:hypothetical protein